MTMTDHAPTTSPLGDTAPPSRPLPQTATIVFCVEAGPMEQQAMWLAESIRRWGGWLSDAPILAIQPRLGPAIRRGTLEAFDRLGVTYRRVRPLHDCWWYGTINKSTALAAAETIADTDLLLWFDTDTLMIADPIDLNLPPGVDYAARPAETALGTTGPDDANEPYWRAVCDGLGLDHEALPWITSHPEGRRIRMYWHGGVYAYRRSTGLAHTHLAIYLKRLDMRIASKRCGVYFYDQTSMTLAVQQLGLKWQALDPMYNYTINKRSDTAWDGDGLPRTKVLHYHDSLWPDCHARFMQLIRDRRPDVHDWLALRGPLRNTLPPHARLYRKALDVLRGRRYRAYADQCTPV